MSLHGRVLHGSSKVKPFQILRRPNKKARLPGPSLSAAALWETLGFGDEPRSTFLNRLAGLAISLETEQGRDEIDP